MAESGLLSTQFSILNFLERKQDCGMSDLAEGLDMDISTVTRNLAPLVSARYVAIRPNRYDKRRKEIRLTSKGKQIIQEAQPAWLQAQDEIVRKIGAKRYKELLETLRAMRS
jgi:DNA-binding MarR family transcriptional regulator